MKHPLELVHALRTAADLTHTPGAVTRHELRALAEELEKWTVEHRHQLEDTTPRATPSNLRTLAAALDTAAKTKKPHTVAANVAESLRWLATRTEQEKNR